MNQQEKAHAEPPRREGTQRKIFASSFLAPHPYDLMTRAEASVCESYSFFCKDFASMDHACK
jgi:hypothetical protein